MIIVYDIIIGKNVIINIINVHVIITIDHYLELFGVLNEDVIFHEPFLVVDYGIFYMLFFLLLKLREHLVENV